MDQRERKRKRAAEKRRREKELKIRITILAVCGAVVLILLVRWAVGAIRAYREGNGSASGVAEEELSRLSEGVLGYRDLVHEYAVEEGIEDHEGVLLAIMEVDGKRYYAYENGQLASGKVKIDGVEYTFEAVQSGCALVR